MFKWLVVDMFGSRLQTMANTPIEILFFFLLSALFVGIVLLLHGIVIHASKLLFWVVKIFNFHLKLAHFAHHVFVSPHTQHNVVAFYGVLFTNEKKIHLFIYKERRNDLCVD